MAIPESWGNGGMGWGHGIVDKSVWQLGWAVGFRVQPITRLGEGRGTGKRDTGKADGHEDSEAPWVRVSLKVTQLDLGLEAGVL